MGIAARQNSDEALLLLAGARRASTLAKRYRRARLGVSAAFVAWAVGMTLGILPTTPFPALLTPAWLTISRLWLQLAEDRHRRKSAALTDRFESIALDMPELAASKLDRSTQAENVALSVAYMKARRIRSLTEATELRDWFITPTSGTQSDESWLAQIDSFEYGIELCRKWRVITLLTGATVGLGLLAISVSQASTLTAFLVGVAAPATPSILDWVESITVQNTALAWRQRALDLASSPQHTNADLVAAKSYAWRWRSMSIGVPDWFYRAVRANMHLTHPYHNTGQKRVADDK